MQQGDEPLEIKFVQQSLPGQEIYFKLFLQDLASQQLLEIEDEPFY